MPPAITIGLPCHGRPEYLRDALEHLSRQTFRDFEILVHENPSGADDIRAIVDGFTEVGVPIRYHRHPENMGVAGNFLSVLKAAESPFFLWAADDDLRHPESLAVLHGLLVAYPDAHLAAGSIEVINSLGESIDHHPDFSRFSTGEDRGEAVLRFLEESEICGKANLIYGLFRTTSLRAAFTAIGGMFPAGWGLDLVLLTAFLSRFGVVGSDRILLRKRTNNARRKPLAKRFPQDFGWPSREFSQFRKQILSAIADPVVVRAAADVLDRRQAHLTRLGAVRRLVMKAVGTDSSRPNPAAPGEAWT